MKARHFHNHNLVQTCYNGHVHQYVVCSAVTGQQLCEQFIGRYNQSGAYTVNIRCKQYKVGWICIAILFAIKSGDKPLVKSSRRLCCARQYSVAIRVLSCCGHNSAMVVLGSDGSCSQAPMSTSKMADLLGPTCSVYM